MPKDLNICLKCGAGLFFDISDPFDTDYEHECLTNEEMEFMKKININKLHKGGLHESLGIPEGKKIPMKKIKKAEHSKSPKIKKQAVLAENFAKIRKKK